MALDQESINQQLELLVAHRRTLAHLLQQAAQFGGEVFAPPQTANGIAVARANITLAKTALCENGVTVEDGPNDDAPSTISPDAIEAARNIAEQRAQDAVLATYISQIEQLVADKNLLKSQPGDEVRVIARARTLATLRRLDGSHNRALILFLRDAGLLVGQPPPLPELPFGYSSANRDLIERPPPIIEPSSIIDLRRGNLAGSNLSEVDLSGLDLQGANLLGANLQKAILSRANLEETELAVADLTFAGLDGANLQGANLSFAKLIRTHLWRANLRGTKLLGAELRSAMLGYTNLQEAQWAGANLQGANLSDIDLQGAFLPRIDLQRAKLLGAKLQGANLSGAELQEADLLGAKLTGADLRGANLQEADLCGANLQEADLRRANLRGAILEGPDPDARLKGLDETARLTANLTGANLQGATMPDGSIHE